MHISFFGHPLAGWKGGGEGRTRVIFYNFVWEFNIGGFERNLGLRQVDTTIYHVTKGYAISAIVTELKMKLTFY